MPSDGVDCVLYVLEPAQRLWRDAAAIQPLAVSTFRARRLRGGLYGREHPLAMSNLVAEDPASFVAIDDQVIGRLLGAPNAQTKRLGSVGDGDTLRRMLETGRCHWRNGQGPALSFEEPRAGRFGWQFDSEGQQHVVCELEDARPDMVIVGLGEPWYIDLKATACGRIETESRIGSRGCCSGRRPCLPPSPAWSARSCSPAPRPSSCPSPCASASARRCARRRCSTCTARGDHLTRPGLEARGAGGRPATGPRPVRLCRCRHRLAGRPLRDQSRQGQPTAGPAARHAVRGADDRAPERLGLQPLGPTGLGRFAPENCRQDFTFEEDDGRRRLDALGRVQSSGPAQARARRLAHHLRRGLSLPGRRRRRRLESRRQQLRHRLVRPRPRHRRRWRAGGAPADLLDLFERAPEDLSPAALDEIGEDHVFGTLPDGRLLPIPAAG